MHGPELAEKGNPPGLKNMYRTVAVFLCTLNGWPVSTTRFATMRVGSAESSDPLATRSGAAATM